MFADVPTLAADHEVALLVLVADHEVAFTASVLRFPCPYRPIRLHLQEGLTAAAAARIWGS